MAIARKYSDELRAESVRRVLERRHQDPSSRSVIREVAEDLGVGVQSLRQWVAKVDDGSYDFSGEDDDSVKLVRAHRSPRDDGTEAPRASGSQSEIDELREENEVLRKALIILARSAKE